MKNSSKALMFSVVSALVLSTAAFSAANLPPSKMTIHRIAATGCSTLNDLSQFHTDKIDLSMQIDNLTVILSGQAPLSSRASCSIRLPVTVPEGYFISKISQTIDLTVDKTSDSNATFAMRATFFGYNVAPVIRSFPEEAPENEVNEILTHTDNFDADQNWISGWCRRGRAEDGLFQGNIVIQGQRDSANASLLIVAGAERYDVEAELTRCP